MGENKEGKIPEAPKKLWQEFKEFINRGNVMNLAVGVMIGGAFSAIVTSLVNDIIMPIVSLFTGGLDFASLCVTLGEGENAATLNYGAFISAIINFLIIAAVIFMMVKIITKMLTKEEAEEAATTRECPFCKETVSIEATKCPHCTSDLPPYEEEA